MTEEPHYPQPQGDAATAHRVRSKVNPEALQDDNLVSTPHALLKAMLASGRESRMEDLQYIPGGRIRLWSDGTITVSLGAIHG